MGKQCGVKAALTVLFAATALAACGQPVSPATERPNVVLILADDIGVETVGAYGSEYPTPRIDSIARNGVRFDAAHATPICTPSRVRLLTGRYNIHNYVDFAVLGAGERTIAHAMRDLGYRTLVSGKWQLSGTGDEDDPVGTGPGLTSIWSGTCNVPARAAVTGDQSCLTTVLRLPTRVLNTVRRS